MKKLLCILLLFTFFINQSFGQKEYEREVLQCPIIGASFGYVLPSGDMGKMFKPFLQVGVNGLYKTKKNWLVGIEGNFNFGSDNLKKDVRNEILGNLYNSAGFIIGTEKITQGTVFPESIDAGLLAYNRGINIMLKGGKIFPLNKKNPNSGIFVMGGVGMTQNKIVYQQILSGAAQLQGDYARGYDRKNRGVQFSEMVGYWFMSNSSRYVNFFVGIECAQSLSKSVREYQFDLKAKDTKTYFDHTYTLKVGWMFPLGSRKAVDFYFN